MTPEQKKVEALLALGRADDAVALADRLPGRETPSVEFLRLRGRALRAAGRVFDAEACFREALSFQPGDPGLLADLATTLLGQRRLKDALPFAREAVQLRPDVAPYHCLRGVVAESLGYDDEAEAALLAARELAPTDAEAHTVYGYHSLRKGRIDVAEKAFFDALANQPDRAEALRGLARCAAQRGDWPAARTRWLDALSADPRQKDRELAPSLVLGHPALAPARFLARMPLGASVFLCAFGAGILVFGDGAWVIPTALTLFGLASIGPGARTLLDRSVRD